MRTFKMSRQERPTKAQLRQAFRPYGAAIGYLVFSWNQLHDRLCQLFQLMVESPSPNLTSAIWHSTDNDYAQRKMLRVAVGKTRLINEAQRADIIWALNKIDESLRHRRNDAIHAPLVIAYSIGKDDDSYTLDVIPNYFSDSPRTKSLRGKNVRREFDEYAAFTDAISDYIAAMGFAIWDPDGHHAWPDKPKLPHAHRTTNRRGSSHRNNAK